MPVGSVRLLEQAHKAAVVVAVEVVTVGVDVAPAGVVVAPAGVVGLEVVVASLLPPPHPCKTTRLPKTKASGANLDNVPDGKLLI